MTIDLILALSLFLGATWLGLLNTIVGLTRDRPVDQMLFALAFVHFVVLVYWVLATSVLYGKAVKSFLDRDLSRLAMFEEILIVTWPAAVLGAILGILATKIIGVIEPLIMVIPFLILAGLLLWWAKRARHLTFVVVVVVLFMPYVFVMAVCWSGVQVTTNQPLYKPGEFAIVTAKTEGYLFKPGINRVEFMTGLYPKYEVPANLITGYVRVVQQITPEMKAEMMVTRPSYISVTYTPQAWWFSRSEEIELNIIP